MEVKEIYLESKYVLEHPNEYHPNDVTRATHFVHGWESAISQQSISKEEIVSPKEFIIKMNPKSQPKQGSTYHGNQYSERQLISYLDAYKKEILSKLNQEK